VKALIRISVSLSSLLRETEDRNSLQRLFSTFANGLPGKGLLILRLAVSTFLIQHSLTALSASAGIADVMVAILAVGAGALLLAGLWTPVAGVIASLLEVWMAFSLPADFRAAALGAAIALALALLGPGAWSIDAHNYGRKRISIKDS
jgi:putative oxidoreductase